jgi:hypothetical protein
MQKVRLDLKGWSDLCVHNQLFNANFDAKLKKNTTYTWSVEKVMSYDYFWEVGNMYVLLKYHFGKTPWRIEKSFWHF